METQTITSALPLPEGDRLAFVRQPGHGPELLFLCGFRSDMGGTKATRLAEHCRRRGQAMTRFDYRGHGASTGRFEDGCVGDWCDDALAILDQVTSGPVLLVGSSMGGWIALLVALARPQRIAALLGIAAAPDFTSELIEPALTPAQRAALDAHGSFQVPSLYGEPLTITRRLIEDGSRHRLLGAPIDLRCPVHLLHGEQDPDVPHALSLRLAAQLRSPAVTVELIADGDHRLSREEDLRRVCAAVDRLTDAVRV